MISLFTEIKTNIILFKHCEVSIVSFFNYFFLKRLYWFEANTYLLTRLFNIFNSCRAIRPSVGRSPGRVESLSCRVRIVGVLRSAPTNETHKSNVTTLKYLYYETFYTKLNIADSLNRLILIIIFILHYNKWPASDRFNSSLTRLSTCLNFISWKCHCCDPMSPMWSASLLLIDKKFRNQFVTP